MVFCVLIKKEVTAIAAITMNELLIGWKKEKIGCFFMILLNP